MATSVEEIRDAEEAEERVLSMKDTQSALVRFTRETSIYFSPQWDPWCDHIRDELEKRTNALIDAEDEKEKARLQGICHTLRWILLQKAEAQGKIDAMRRDLDEIHNPAAGDSTGEGAADL